MQNEKVDNKKFWLVDFNVVRIMVLVEGTGGPLYTPCFYRMCSA